MQYRALGTTGIHVSTIGFGASPLGGVFGDVDAPTARTAVAAAIDAGLNIFDVAPYYGLTLAEDRLGDALSGHRADVILATKCGRYGAASFDFSAKTIAAEFENSLRRLRTDYVDILQAHDIEFGDVDQVINETIPAMRKLQEQGKVRFIGITGYWPGMLASVASSVPVDTVLNYCQYNLLSTNMEYELTPFAKRSGIGLLNASPLHMGLLGGGKVPPWHPAPAPIRSVGAEIVDLCRIYGVEPSTVALHFCLQHPEISSTFIGISDAKQVQACRTALAWHAKPELMKAIQGIVAPVAGYCWPSGRPENSDATVSTPVEVLGGEIR